MKQLFLSTYENKVDKKGRVSVPSAYRNVLAEQSFPGVVAYRSYANEAIECCGMDRMEKLSENIDELDWFSEEQDDLATIIFADAHQLAFDPEGRIQLPQILMDHAGITDRASFVGKGKTFQIWDPARFAAYQEAARERARKQGRTLPGGKGEAEK